MFRKMSMALAATMMMAGVAHADPIEGSYRTPKTGATAKVSPCGSNFCMTYTSGKFSGKRFATFKAKGDGSYTGELTDYSDGAKKYTGKAKMQGRNVIVSGCILMGLACSSETFTRL